MSGGTKIILAVIGLLVIVLITYYGFMLPKPTAGASLNTPGSAENSAPGTPGTNTTIQDPTGHPFSNSMQSEPESIQMGGGSSSQDAPEQFVSRPQGLLSSGLRNTTPLTPPETVDSINPPSDPPANGQPQPAPTVEDPLTTPAPAPGAGQAKPNQPAAIPVDYTIRSGDTLMTIAANWYGDAYDWQRIVRANPGLDPLKLRIGQRILLPASDGVPLNPAPLAGQESQLHVVKAGDTLSGLAKAFYGNGGLWERIFMANRTKLRGDPDALQVGMKLMIPAMP